MSSGLDFDESIVESSNAGNQADNSESDVMVGDAHKSTDSEEALKLKQMQEADSDHQMQAENANLTPEEKALIDGRSIYVGNVDYSATAEELEQHFHGCGSINRVTILCDKYSGHPKGFAYVEFAERDSVEIATALDDSLFKGRQIKVSTKRTNRPGVSTTNRPPRGRGGYRGGFRGGRGGFAPQFGGGPWFPRGRGRGGFRGRGYYGYSPY